MNLTVAQKYDRTVCLIETTGNHRNALWEQWSVEAGRLNRCRRVLERWTRYEWEQDSAGLMVTVGRLANRPVVVSLQWAWINGKLVCFWEPTSELVDYAMVASWLRQVMPDAAQSSTFIDALRVIAPVYDDAITKLGEIARVNEL